MLRSWTCVRHWRSQALHTRVPALSVTSGRTKLSTRGPIPMARRTRSEVVQPYAKHKRLEGAEQSRCNYFRHYDRTVYHVSSTFTLMSMTSLISAYAFMLRTLNIIAYLIPSVIVFQLLTIHIRTGSSLSFSQECKNSSSLTSNCKRNARLHGYVSRYIDFLFYIHTTFRFNKYG